MLLRLHDKHERKLAALQHEVPVLERKLRAARGRVVQLQKQLDALGRQQIETLPLIATTTTRRQHQHKHKRVKLDHETASEADTGIMIPGMVAAVSITVPVPPPAPVRLTQSSASESEPHPSASTPALPVNVEQSPREHESKACTNAITSTELEEEIAYAKVRTAKAYRAATRKRNQRTHNSRVFAAEEKQNDLNRMHQQLARWQKHTQELEQRLELARRANELLTEYLCEVSPLLAEWHRLGKDAEQKIAQAAEAMGGDGDVTTPAQQRDAAQEELVLEFLKRFEPESMSTTEFKRAYANDTSMCPTCQQELVKEDITLVCARCGFSRTDVICSDTDGISFEEAKNRTFTKKNNYQRLSHFRDLLRLVQGHVKQQVEPRLVQQVRGQFIREDIDFHSVTPDKVRVALRKLHKRQAMYKACTTKDERISYVHYYKYIVAITMQINKTFRPVRIADEHMELLCHDFQLAEEAFERVRCNVDPDRKSFLGYNYVARQLCLRRGYNEYLDALKLMKTDRLVANLDKFWDEICRDLGWEFFSSIGNVQYTRTTQDNDNNDDDDNVSSSMMS